MNYKNINKIIILFLKIFLLLSLSCTNQTQTPASPEGLAGNFIKKIISFNENINYELLENNDVHIEKVFENFAIVIGTVPANKLDQINNNSTIKGMDDINDVVMSMDTAAEAAGIVNGRETYNIDGDRDGNPNSYSKDDVVIAILDTGIDTSHADLDGGKVIAWYDAVAGRPTPYDNHGHGTHCAGIAAGDGEGNLDYLGVAPGAALVAVKVLPGYGPGTNEDVIEGMHWVLENKDRYGIDIVSMSLGIPNNGIYDAVAEAADTLVANGLTVVASAGNVAQPSVSTIGSPGCAYDVITVGSVSDPSEGGWNIGSLSSSGPLPDGRIKPDISAPGVNITAAEANTISSYTTLSGTSMATPFVAGTIALYYDLYYHEVTPADVKKIIEGTAIDMGINGKDNIYGSGRLDVEAFLEYSISGPDTIKPTVSITEPATNDLVQNIVTISVDAADNREVKNVIFYVDNEYIGTDNSAPYAIDWDSSTVPDGTHRIEVIASDMADNTRADEILLLVEKDYVIKKVTETLTGSVAGREVQYFELKDVETGQINLSVNWNGNTDIDVYICERPQYYNYLATGNTTTNPETTSYLIQSEGTYYIAVRMYYQSAPDTPYTVTISYYKGSVGGTDTQPPTVGITTPSHEL